MPSKFSRMSHGKNGVIEHARCVMDDVVLSAGLCILSLFKDICVHLGSKL